MALATWKVALLLAASPLTAACVANGTPEYSDTGESSDTSAIVHGRLSGESEDAVLDLWLKDGGGWATCTGSLIAPNVVLTAYHCVAREAPNGDDRCPVISSGNAVYTEHSAIYGDHLEPANIYVSLSRQRSTAAGAKFVAHGREIVDDATRLLCSHDIALVMLDQPITTVEPMKIRGTSVLKGELLSAIGWGDLNDNGAAVKDRMHRAGIRVLALQGEIFKHTRQDGAELVEAAYQGEFVTGTATCHGDSGGPMLDGNGEIVGVASRGSSTGGCVDVLKTFTDVSAHLTLIDRALELAGAVSITAKR